MPSCVKYEDVLQAQRRISPFVKTTPVMTSSTLNQTVGRQIFLKCESFQKTGSFKVRGALNAVLKLRETRPDATGVVTSSSGNHGQALAWAAQTVGLSCSVAVSSAVRVKHSAIKGYGVEQLLHDPCLLSRRAFCKSLVETTDHVYIPSADHPDVIAGQGTVAVELLSQVPHLDAILVPVCRGGLAAGVAIVAKAICPHIKVFSVVPKGKNLAASLISGEQIEHEVRSLDTIADGLRAEGTGEHTLPIMCELLEKEVFSMTDDEIREAMRFMFERMKLVVEPSSAIGVAAAMSETMANMDPSLRKIAVILGGGNVDLDVFSNLV